MLKRRTTRYSGEGFNPLLDISTKRTRIEEVNGGAAESDVEVINNTSTPEEPSKVAEVVYSGLLRDPDYYFKDGNIIFRVEETLFKVHMSLLELQSKKFETVFGIPQVPTGAEPGKSKRILDHPITLSDISVHQFHSLMKIIYHPFSHKHLLTLPDASASGEDTAISFDFYLNVATSSHRFAMENIEQWAMSHLDQMLRTSGKLIAGSLDDTFGDDTDEKDSGRESGAEDRSKHVDENPVALEEFCAFRLVKAMSYARAIANTRMFNNCLATLQFYCALETRFESGLQLLQISLFRMRGLRESNPALFGSLFLVLLCKGNKSWSHSMHTHMDRMALFSAQSYLTPLPDSFKTSAPLLFSKPLASKVLVKIFSRKAADYVCTSEQCRSNIFLFWQRTFDDDYYGHINSHDFITSITAMNSLPSRRLDFSCQIRGIKCSQGCYEIILLQLDEMIQGIYIRLGEYYKGFD